MAVSIKHLSRQLETILRKSSFIPSSTDTHEDEIRISSANGTLAVKAGRKLRKAFVDRFGDAIIENTISEEDQFIHDFCTMPNGSLRTYEATKCAVLNPSKQLLNDILEDIEEAFDLSETRDVDDPDGLPWAERASPEPGDDLPVSTELASSRVMRILNAEDPKVQPTDKAGDVQPPSAFDLGGSPAETLSSFADFVIKVGTFERRMAAKGNDLSEIADIVLSQGLSPRVHALVDQRTDGRDFRDSRELLRFVREGIFSKFITQGFDAVRPRSIPADGDVDVHLAQFVNLLTFFPRTTVREAKRALLEMFDGWPLRSTLEQLALSAVTKNAHLSFEELRRAASSAGADPRARPSPPKPRPTTINAVDLPTRPRRQIRRGPNVDKECAHCSGRLRARVVGHDADSCFILHPELQTASKPPGDAKRSQPADSSA